MTTYRYVMNCSRVGQMGFSLDDVYIISLMSAASVLGIIFVVLLLIT